ncbi:hypothetical protein [Campylobacter lanienae]|uniref:hypothetical protein n=1 Tax=Campylobacter lanienae TaxID=75658 RepID=UPI000BB40A68|nr:hypothetical protein [Campylobacter lanienae]
MSGVYTELLTALESVGELSGKSHKEIEKKFDEIAKILLTKTKIVKGEKNSENYKEYYITDIEFYLYCDGHEDIITYPRNCKAGDWFFHDSGVDISFGSNLSFKDNKAILKNNSFFGGILLRGIKPVGGYSSSKNLTDAPKNIVDELFDKFSAFEESEHFLVNFPLLKEESGHDLKDQKLNNIATRTYRHHILRKCENNKIIKGFIGKEEIDRIKSSIEEIKKYSTPRAELILSDRYVINNDKGKENIIKENIIKENIINAFADSALKPYRYTVDQTK